MPPRLGLMFLAALRKQLAHNPGRPLLTHYDQTNRIELSYATFGNWVDKTCNLLDTLLVEPGEPIDLQLLDSHPGHWVTLVWLVACWQYGCPVKQPDRPAALRVGDAHLVAEQTPSVACSLHPLGQGFAEVPAGCVDYVEVLAEPDVCLAPQPPANGLAWGQLTLADVAATKPRSDRQLFIDPTAAWATAQNLIVAPLLGGGSSVIATGCSAATLAQVHNTERID